MKTTERLNKCPLCKSGLFLNHLKVKDNAISKEEFLICKCSKCTLTFTNPRPDQTNIGKYYISEEYISHKDKSNNLINVIYKLVRNFTIKKKVSILNHYTSQKRKVLDIGAGTGYFLAEAIKQDWKVLAIEPNQEARQQLSKKNIKAFESLSYIKKGKKFTAITLFHVLEHIHELRKTGKTINKLLEDNGTLFIAVPNLDSWDSNHYQENWAAWDVPRHLYHFNQKSIYNFAEEFGFHIIDTLAMPFDSYYVSILSEKHINLGQSSLIHLIKGLIKGWKSNKWAKKNNNNYSSLLFILKKK
jgi:2-polyprenyl-3-methyl-5-hydroxy-6-metoxy-1,4-benzoquinol methylase